MSRNVDDHLNNDAQRLPPREHHGGHLSLDRGGADVVGVGIVDGQVMLRFPRAVTSVGFAPRLALEVAVSMMKHARRAGVNEPLVWRVGEPRPYRADES